MFTTPNYVHLAKLLYLGRILFYLVWNEEFGGVNYNSL